MASRLSQLKSTEVRGPEERRGTRRQFPTYLVAALLLAAFVAFAVSTYGSVKRELTQAAMARSAALSRLAAATLSERLDRVVDLAVSLATRVRLTELVAKGDWAGAGTILRTVPERFPYVRRLFLADTHGTLLFDVPARPGVRGLNFAHRAWYRGVSSDWRTYVSPLYRRTAAPQVDVIAVATPVRRHGTDEVTGILVAQLGLDTFFDWSKSIDVGPDAALVVVDPLGQAAYTSGGATLRPVQLLTADGVLEHLRRRQAGVEIARDPDVGGDSLYAFDPASHGWGVVVRQPARAAFAARDRQLMLLQVAYALFVLLAASVTWTGLRVAARRREQLERVRLTLARHAERLRILGEIDRAMVAEKPAEEVAAAVIEPLRELLGVPRVVVNRFDLEAGTAEWIAAAGRRRQHAGPGVRYPLAFMGDVERLRRGETQRVDVSALAGSAETKALLDSDVRYYEVVPMIAGGELLGAISFGGPDNAFPAEQVAIVQEVATQLAIATRHSRLLARVRGHADELESQVRARTAELEAANRELEAFSYSVSHDLRAPLRAVDGFGRMLEEDHAGRLDGEGRRLLGVVRESSRAMGRLIDDLLAFSRLAREPLARRDVDMRALANGALEELRRDWPGDVELGALPAARADPALLRQAWLNLLANALKYSGKRERPAVQVGGKSEGGECVYWVRDNGVGFDMRYADKLFRVFQRLHSAEEFPGTGVGLAIVQRVVNRHGGRVWAEGAPDAGACFYFALPREAE
jgi:signal transduction histidine kinase